MWRQGGLIFAVFFAGTLSAAGQEQSTEATCIARLRQTVDHLGKIEQQLDGANKACVANDDAAARRQIDELNQALAQSKRDLADRQAEVDKLKGGFASAGARLKKIDTAAGQQVRAALPGLQTGCGEKLDIDVVDGVVRLSGSLLNVDDAVRRAREAVRAIPGVEVRSDELTRLNLCGRSLGDGWSIEVADGVPRRIGLEQVDAVYSRLPEGSDETCRSIGAKLDKLTDLDASRRNTFWVRLQGQRTATCSAADGQWKLVPEQINLNALQALVVQHSQ
jgi:hypothetical protein